MGHPQPPTPMQTDNATAHALITNKIRPKALKSMEMRFNFLKCCQAQEQFRFYWAPGVWNLADYFTKHHAPSHHRNTRSLYLTSPDDPEYTNFFSSIQFKHVALYAKLFQTQLFQTQVRLTCLYSKFQEFAQPLQCISMQRQGCVRPMRSI